MSDSVCTNDQSSHSDTLVSVIRFYVNFVIPIVIQLFFPFCTHCHFHFISFRATTLVLKWNNLTSSTTYGEGEVLALVFKFIGQNWPLVSHLFKYCTPRLERRAGVSSTVRRRPTTREAEVTVLKIHIDRYIRIPESEFLFLDGEFRVLESVFWLKDSGIPLTIGFQNPSSDMTRNWPYSRYPLSLLALKDWWDKSNVTWLLRGQTSDKIYQYNKSGLNLFILDKKMKKVLSWRR